MRLLCTVLVVVALAANHSVAAEALSGTKSNVLTPWQHDERHATQVLKQHQSTGVPGEGEEDSPEVTKAAALKHIRGWAVGNLNRIADVASFLDEGNSAHSRAKEAIEQIHASHDAHLRDIRNGKHSMYAHHHEDTTLQSMHMVDEMHASNKAMKEDERFEHVVSLIETHQKEGAEKARAAHAKLALTAEQRAELGM